MTLQLKSTARLFDLHCSVGLTDWDMDRELKLATTTDQFYHGDGFSFLSFSFAQVIPHKAQLNTVNVGRRSSLSVCE